MNKKEKNKSAAILVLALVILISFSILLSQLRHSAQQEQRYSPPKQLTTDPVRIDFTGLNEGVSIIGDKTSLSGNSGKLSISSNNKLTGNLIVTFTNLNQDSTLNLKYKYLNSLAETSREARLSALNQRTREYEELSILNQESQEKNIQIDSRYIDMTGKAIIAVSFNLDCLDNCGIEIEKAVVTTI